LTTASATVTDLADGVVAALDQQRNGRPRRIPAPAQRPARQQFEAGIRALIGIAGRLALLDDGDQRVEARIVLGDMSMPRRLSSLMKFDLPPWSETITLAEIADLSGGHARRCADP
jgi:hypothetical protein